MKNLLLKFCLVIVGIFSLIGIIFVSVVIHEYMHMNDFRNTNIDLENESIRINIPLEIKNILDFEGVYSVLVKQQDSEFVQNEVRYTEYKAYAVSIFFIIVCCLAFIFILFKIEYFQSFEYWENLWSKDGNKT